MKFSFVFFIVLSCFSSLSQVDTIICDYSIFSEAKIKDIDGYYIIKKNDVKIHEYKKVNNKMIGLCKSYYDNGGIEEISEYALYHGRNMYSGIYKIYYLNGNLKTEGIFQIQDSIECIGCYDNDLLKDIHRAQSNTMKIGAWEQYHENGKLSPIGIYKGIHEVYYADLRKGEKVGVFYVGAYTENYLQDKLREYYNEKGFLIREETSKNGFLVGVINH